MDFKTIVQIILLGVALSADAFAVSVTYGLAYRDVTKKRSFFIASVFGFMQGFMPLIGFLLVELIEVIVGEAAGSNAGNIMSNIVSWIAFVLLLCIGLKMILDGIKELKASLEEKTVHTFKVKEVLYFGFATAIDALGSGVAMHTGLSTMKTIWLHVPMIMLITFGISLIGLFLGKQIEKLFKGKVEITSIIGGSILILLAIWILLSNILGI